MSRAVMSVVKSHIMALGVVLDTSFHNSLQKYTIFVSRTYINLWHTNAAIFLYFLSFYTLSSWQLTLGYMNLVRR